MDKTETPANPEIPVQVSPGDRWILIVQKPGDPNLTMLQSETITEGPAIVIGMLSACINNICRLMLQQAEKPRILSPGPFFIPRRNGG